MDDLPALSNGEELTREERKIEVVMHKRNGIGFREIGTILGMSATYAHDLYWEAMGEVKAPNVQQLRAQQNAILEDLTERAYKIAAKDHYVVSGGKIVNGPDGIPLVDDGAKLDAQKELRALVIDQAKLNGTMAPVQAVINGEIRYEVAGVNMDLLR